ncbi:uncharacterized protein B0H18DRAFT_1118858 [Fomitopsis serialis]|uniref:uncharacterized protein n=1 Tax=Fomitopsis serialis TaxID=139415 RepID=UPI0020074F4F|nr:uncharacterized protein B0H18DRAFT_1118858 [Neoantrodia serialis]KAH9926800.1 hypothetical protein B0H18DRAFT_1118858 [Neoantrodia serialis]
MYWLVRQRQVRVEEETDEAFATIRRAHAIATQAATRDRTQALVSVFSSGSIGTATDLAGSGGPEDSSFSISERICMAVAKLWVSPSSVAAMRAALEGDLRSPHDIDVTTLYLGGTLEWRAHQWIAGLGFLFAVLDTTWPAFTRRVRPRYLPAGVLVGLIGMNSLLQFQHCWLPFHVRNRHAVAAVLRDRFRLKGDAVSVQD